MNEHLRQHLSEKEYQALENRIGTIVDCHPVQSGAWVVRVQRGTLYHFSTPGEIRMGLKYNDFRHYRVN